MKKTLLAAATAALFSVSVMAAGPAGFAPAPASPGARAPQGFETAAKLTTVAQIKASARDHEVVALRGSFTEHIRKEKYVFTDQEGATIQADLDDDKDWSHVAKNAPVEIVAEVDKDWNKIELEVISAKPLK